jgi:hypothetical protein
MDITLRKLATTPAEIAHLNDLAEQCEERAKTATILARQIRAYARQLHDRSLLSTDSSAALPPRTASQVPNGCHVVHEATTP